MKCPIDGTELQMAERQGIEIDYCPQCRGVWLDRGELDKIIERSAAYEQPPARKPKPTERDYDHDYDDDDYYRGDPSYPKRKRKSFLSEIFDIFD